MICQICGKNLATVHYRSVINGKIREIYMCRECAARGGKTENNKNTEGAFGMSYFESKFTDKAEHVISHATEKAKEWGHSFVGTEHILYALSAEENSVAKNVLNECGLTPEKVFECIKGIRGLDMPVSNVRGLTPRVKRIIEIALLEGQKLGHSYIGTEHILMAILRDGESVAARIIAELSGNAQKIYYDLIKSKRNKEKNDDITSN